jgi:hypothetical protein
MGEIINTRKVLIGISEEKKLHEDGGVDGTVILKRTLKIAGGGGYRFVSFG